MLVRVVAVAEEEQREQNERNECMEIVNAGPTEGGLAQNAFGGEEEGTDQSGRKWTKNERFKFKATKLKIFL